LHEYLKSADSCCLHNKRFCLASKVADSWLSRSIPMFIGPPGSGKGILLAHLLISVLGKCGMHCIDFDVGTDRFNNSLDFKAFVIVKEGEHVYTTAMQCLFKKAATSDMYICFGETHRSC